MEISEREFKITMTNVLRALKEKVDSMQEQMGSVSRDGNSRIQWRKDSIFINGIIGY